MSAGSGRGRPLAGLRILEVGHMLAGPYATMLLADLGADVIKIEPEGGDISRRVGPTQVGPHNAYFASLNRNKRSVCIDLSSDSGQKRLGELVSTAHALLVNLRPSTVVKLGLTYDSLRRWNESIVCVALTGFGLEGSASEKPAFDYVIQALSGLASLTGDPAGPPVLAGYSAVDNSAGIMAALGLLAKVVEGRGGQVDVSLHDVMLSQLNYLASAYLNSGKAPARRPMGAHLYYVPAQLFGTRDGHLALFVTHDDFWRRFCDEVERPEWKRDPRFASMEARLAHREVVVGAIADLLRGDDTERWVARLSRHGIVVAGVQSLADALDGEIARERRMVVRIETQAGPLRLVGNPIKVDGGDATFAPPPLLGEHDEELRPAGPARRSRSPAPGGA